MPAGTQHMLLRPRQILAPVIFATVFGYFGYHLVNGDRGLLAMAHLQREVLIAEQNFAEAETTRKIWERRVAALRNQSLEPDMLDERARVLLNFARKDDIIVFMPTR
ncbi:MAG: septum formation initiator family protein [Reyranella sp.]|nr:septum formation initiator family protein [Reyranella sp.]